MAGYFFRFNSIFVEINGNYIQFLKVKLPSNIASPFKKGSRTLTNVSLKHCISSDWNRLVYQPFGQQSGMLLQKWLHCHSERLLNSYRYKYESFLLVLFKYLTEKG